MSSLYECHFVLQLKKIDDNGFDGKSENSMRNGSRVFLVFRSFLKIIKLALPS